MLHQHNFIRDLAVYSISSFLQLKKAGKVRNFFNEMGQFKLWYKFRRSKEGTLHYRIPWLVFGSIRFLKNWLTPGMKIYEYGSGGSTLFFAERVKELYSVEHDASWYQQTRQTIDELKLDNIRYKLIEPEFCDNYQHSNYMNTDTCISAQAGFEGKSFRTYVHSIETFADHYFDLVVIDGRARQSCIKASTNKIKTGGILLLDNAERNYYIALNPELNDKTRWERIDFTGHFPFAPASVLNVTSLFKKLY